jgi:hypothetical protein
MITKTLAERLSVRIPLNTFIMRYYDNYYTRISVGASIVTEYKGKPKVFKVYDMTYSEQGNVERNVVVTVNKKFIQIPISKCELVPTDKQLEYLQSDLKQFTSHIKTIEHLINNHKLRDTNETTSKT